MRNLKSMELNLTIDTAAALCEQYNWPEQAAYLREHRRVPEGFAHEVGKTISLFMQAPPLGGLVYRPDPPNHSTYAEMREIDHRHGERLARLRMLLAKINLENRNATS